MLTNPKVLSTSKNIANDSKMDTNDGQGDKWWFQVVQTQILQMTVTADVTAQAHCSHLTRKDFEYNGLDIQVGDWIAGATTGLCCRIVSISAKASIVQCVVEDWLRYNTFRSSTCTPGVFGTGAPVVFH